jgi:hypothetical protein
VSEDFLVFGIGIDGSGVVGGREGRGSAVVAMVFSGNQAELDITVCQKMNCSPCRGVNADVRVRANRECIKVESGLN